MKILYFHQHFGTPAGSGGTRSYEFAKRLIARGHEVTMVCGSYSGAATGLAGAFAGGVRRGVVEGISIVELELPYSNNDGFAKRSLTFLRFALRSILFAMREPCDLVFATTTPLTAGIPGIFASLLRRKPFVFEVRDLWPELPRAMGVITNPVVLAMMSALEWSSYHAARICIGLAPGIVQGIVRRGIPAERVRLVPNAADLDLFGAAADAPWRPEEVKESDLMAVFTGTHGIANGLDAVLDAAAELKKRGRHDIKLVMIGQGKLKKDLMARAAAQALDSCVFCDPVPKRKLSGLMRASDVGLMILANVPAFYFGTSPNKFFDYIAAGIPVLNNYPGWLADMIAEHQCGIAVPPGDPKAFADALERFADDRATLKSMGKNGRRLAERQFDRAVLADSFVDILEEAWRA